MLPTTSLLSYKLGHVALHEDRRCGEELANGLFDGRWTSKSLTHLEVQNLHSSRSVGLTWFVHAFVVNTNTPTLWCFLMAIRSLTSDNGLLEWSIQRNASWCRRLSYWPNCHCTGLMEDQHARLSFKEEHKLITMHLTAKRTVEWGGLSSHETLKCYWLELQTCYCFSSSDSMSPSCGGAILFSDCIIQPSFASATWSEHTLGNYPFEFAKYVILTVAVLWMTFAAFPMLLSECWMSV